MKPRITVITLGVDNLERSLAFYRDGLGLKTDGIIGQEFEHGAVAFIALENGAKIALWPRKSIAHDTGLSIQYPSSTEFTLGHNLNSKKEVDEVMSQAQETFWGGYSGYFQDPNGHLWEVTWNPDWKIEE